MGWKRIGNHRYFYVQKREGSRFVSEYIGRGEVAKLWAEFKRIDRQERHVRRDEAQEDRATARAEEREVAAWYDAIEAVAVGFMLALGYHRHDRGGWRKRQRSKAMTEAIGGAAAATPARLTGDDLDGLFERAQSGDNKALNAMRRALKSGEHPGWEKWFRDRGDLDKLLKVALASEAAGGRLGDVEAYMRGMERVRDELAGPNPTAIERLLAERAAACWFAVNSCEISYALAKDLSIDQAGHHIKKIDSAHRRFLQSLRTLSAVRRVVVQNIQVNVTEPRAAAPCVCEADGLVSLNSPRPRPARSAR